LRTKCVVFADLDGTFLDENYDCKAILPIVNQLEALGGSIVFCSSKTQSEIEYYREMVGLSEPFISENGAAIFIPKSYFPFSGFGVQKTFKYDIIRLGASYTMLREKLVKVKRKTAAKIIGFGDMTLEEIAQDAGLTLKLAKLAKKREHDEPFRIVEGDKAIVVAAIKNEGLRCTEGGRYLHLMGNTDKGKAIAVLKALYCRMFGRVETFAIGDGLNDLSMLKAVDNPFFIKSGSQVNSRFYMWEELFSLLSSKLCNCRELRA
jgi:mannosyl-3-phosphoglycerate phosphatase